MGDKGRADGGSGSTSTGTGTRLGQGWRSPVPSRSQSRGSLATSLKKLQTQACQSTQRVFWGQRAEFGPPFLLPLPTGCS